MQLIRNHAARRQRLGDAEPVREFLDFDLPRGRDTGIELAFTTIGEYLRTHRFVEGSCRDVLAAQPFAAIETKITFELSQLKGGLGQFQSSLCRFEVDHDIRLLAFDQRDIQLELALQIPLAFPAGERLGSTDWRFLENFQAVTQAAGKPAVKEQMSALSCRSVRNVDVNIADLGVEQLTLAGQNPHAAVLDEHVPRNLADVRPARLERQLGIVHFEKQADAAGGIFGTVVQRALVLEETLIDCTLENRRTQPFVECRAQDRRQVLGGIATVPVHQADPQVHVVFLVVVEMQPDQEVTGNLAFLAQYLQVRRDQGEAFFIELPGQPGIGLDVLPRLGENRVQVQQEILAVHAQLAVAKVSADTAADIPCRRSAVVGVEADPIKIGGKAELAVVGGIGPHVDQNVAQATDDLEPLDRRGKTFR